MKIGDRVCVNDLAGQFHAGRTGRIVREFLGAPVIDGRVVDWWVVYDDISFSDGCPYREQHLIVIEES